jgi:hypothetical protein
MRHPFLCFLLILASCASPSPEQSDGARLIGSWDLIEWSGERENGEQVHPYGTDALGMLIYTTEGTVSLSLSKGDRPDLGSDDYSQMSRDTLLEAYSGFFSYHGSYSIDSSEKRITHVVEACKIPDWSGREQTRLYSFSHDTLILHAEKVIGLRHKLTWVKR